ncbi:MAG TPA: glucose-6-phosphate dehydrogenase [Thermoanaerobaculia bacterium]|nr:glucose-6-phosphate dehydrogenase [Thermoanaerobaculia bacterium]
MPTRVVEPYLFVIFGASGDLVSLKLLPAVYRLSQQGSIRGQHRILGAARTEYSDESFREFAIKALREDGIDDADAAEWCKETLYYQTMEGSEQQHYQALADRIETMEREANLPGNRVFYLAVPPKVFPTITNGLGQVGLNKGKGWTRLVVEKPFGWDLPSAEDLNEQIHQYFSEDQIYRIDHFLGKETVQNLLVFRFANAIFESLWNREHVRDIQITVSEGIGIGSRAGYYDNVGAMRDMVQNHLTQILTLLAMEVPISYEAESIRHEKIKVLRSVAAIQEEDVVLGQYAAGVVNGEEVPSYLDEVGKESQTETYIALRLAIDNWRWQGVPFYLRTGKRMPKRLTQITVNFRRPPVCLFESLECTDLGNDSLVMTLQPDEGFSLYFDVKQPGEPLRLKNIPLHFRYQEAFGPLPDAYVTLLLDILTGDQTLFVHADEAEASWRLYTPLLTMGLPIHKYAAGSRGPAAADKLLEREGNSWRKIE